MAHSHLLIAVPLALALSAGAYAGDDSKTSADQADSVEVLKAALPSTLGFEVVDVRAGADGAACITYNFTNDLDGESRACGGEGGQGAARDDGEYAVCSGVEQGVCG